MADYIQIKNGSTDAYPVAPQKETVSEVTYKTQTAHVTAHINRLTKIGNVVHFELLINSDYENNYYLNSSTIGYIPSGYRPKANTIIPLIVVTKTDAIVPYYGNIVISDGSYNQSATSTAKTVMIDTFYTV